MLNWLDKSLLTTIFDNLNFATSLIGLVGNTLMFFAFFERDLQKLSASVYYRSMAIACLIMNIYWLGHLSVPWHGFVLAHQSLFWCKLVVMAEIVSNVVSSWFQVAASLDTFLTIVFPTRFHLIKTQSIRLVLVFVLTLYAIGSSMFLFFSIHLKVTFFNENQFSIGCEVDKDKLNDLILSSLLNSAVVPFFFMLVFSVATLVCVMKSRKRAAGRRSRGDSHPRTRDGLNGQIRARDLKFGITLIVLNLAFLLTNAPYTLLFSRSAR